MTTIDELISWVELRSDLSKKHYAQFDRSLKNDCLDAFQRGQVCAYGNVLDHLQALKKCLVEKEDLEKSDDPRYAAMRGKESAR